MVEMTLLTALRLNDMLQLKKSQLESGGIRVKPSKTSDSTEAEVLFIWTPALSALVDRCLQRRRGIDTELVFPVSRGARKGSAYTVGSFQNVRARYFKRCGVAALTWHDLRRTALNLMHAQQGKEAAQLMAAHSSLVTTEGYLAGVGLTQIQHVDLSNMRTGRLYEKQASVTTAKKKPPKPCDSEGLDWLGD